MRKWLMFGVGGFIGILLAALSIIFQNPNRVGVFLRTVGLGDSSQSSDIK